MGVYESFREQIEDKLSVLELSKGQEEDLVPFDPADFVQNPIALARMKAGIKQVDLAKKMEVSQAYISKLEHAETVSESVVNRVLDALRK